MVRSEWLAGGQFDWRQASLFGLSLLLVQLLALASVRFGSVTVTMWGAGAMLLGLLLLIFRSFTFLSRVLSGVTVVVLALSLAHLFAIFGGEEAAVVALVLGLLFVYLNPPLIFYDLILVCGLAGLSVVFGTSVVFWVVIMTAGLVGVVSAVRDNYGHRLGWLQGPAPFALIHSLTTKGWSVRLSEAVRSPQGFLRQDALSPIVASSVSVSVLSGSGSAVVASSTALAAIIAGGLAVGTGRKNMASVVVIAAQAAVGLSVWTLMRIVV